MAQFFRSQSPTIQTWQDLERVRRAWPGTLVLKGVMHPDDAVRAVALGCDGVILSNHGGQGIGHGPGSSRNAAGRAASRGPRVSVMLDGGIRRGSDVVLARCLGADFVFLGRAMLFAVSARGLQGARGAIAILKDEIDRTLALVGVASVAALGPEYLYRPGR